jgi:8-oxo-dGTP pyrophosphatase MutT (NUDIX family)
MDYINGLRKYIGDQPLLMVGSTVLVLDAQNRLLMMKRSDSGNWGVPGGAMELGETTEETARRELLEETSLEVDELTLFGVFSGSELYYPTRGEVYLVSAFTLPMMFMELSNF